MKLRNGLIHFVVVVLVLGFVLVSSLTKPIYKYVSNTSVNRTKHGK